MKKKRIIILIIVIVLLFGGIAAWLSFSKKTTGIPDGFLTEPAKQEEIFGLTGWVLEKDAKNNFLIIKTEKDKREVKALVDKDTKLLKIELPADHPGNGYVITIKTPMKLIDFQKGDYISLRTRENIAGRAEFDGIIQIYFYPHFTKLKEN